MEIVFSSKLRADYVWRMLVTILFKVSYRLLSKNIKIEIYKTMILPVVSYRCENSPVTLKHNTD